MLVKPGGRDSLDAKICQTSAIMVDIQVKTSDLLSLSQQLIPKQLALAFGIALGDEHHEDDKQALLHNSIAVKARTSQERQPSASLKRHRDADGGTDSRPATSAAKGGAPPTSSQQTTPAPHPAVSQPAATSALQQMSSGMQQQDAAAMAHAAASMQAAALAQQAAASMQTTTAMAHAQAAAAAATSMQTTSGLSGGYHAHPSAAAPGGPAMLSAYRGFPAAAVGHAYHYNGHPLMPYMHAAPQAMPTMSGISGMWQPAVSDDWHQLACTLLYALIAHQHLLILHLRLIGSDLAVVFLHGVSCLDLKLWCDFPLFLQVLWAVAP